MKSVLKELENKYALIIKTESYELTKEIEFKDDIKHAFEALMQTINKAYIKNLIPKKKIRVFLKRTHSGKCYLKVIGRDRNTVLIIRQEYTKYSEFAGITGYKVTEKELAKTIDIIQRDKLEKAGISKRFIKEIIPELDLYEEMQIEQFINICKKKYITINQPTSIELYDEPENTSNHIKRTHINKGTSVERMNPVIPYEERKRELIKYRQKQIIRFQGKKTSNLFDAYIYIKNGFVLAIIEPISGLGYQYNLNLGFAEDYNEENVKMMIKAALESEESIVMKDDAMIRKNHTTIENFKNNIEVFLNFKELDKRFITKVEKANQVYKKIKTLK